MEMDFSKFSTYTDQDLRPGYSKYCILKKETKSSKIEKMKEKGRKEEELRDCLLMILEPLH